MSALLPAQSDIGRFFIFAPALSKTDDDTHLKILCFYPPDTPSTPRELHLGLMETICMFAMSKSGVPPDMLDSSTSVTLIHHPTSDMFYILSYTKPEPYQLDQSIAAVCKPPPLPSPLVPTLLPRIHSLLRLLYFPQLASLDSMTPKQLYALRMGVYSTIFSLPQFISCLNRGPKSSVSVDRHSRIGIDSEDRATRLRRKIKHQQNNFSPRGASSVTSDTPTMRVPSNLLIHIISRIFPNPLIIDNDGSIEYVKINIEDREGLELYLRMVTQYEHKVATEEEREKMKIFVRWLYPGLCPESRNSKRPTNAVKVERHSVVDSAEQYSQNTSDAISAVSQDKNSKGSQKDEDDLILLGSVDAQQEQSEMSDREKNLLRVREQVDQLEAEWMYEKEEDPICPNIVTDRELNDIMVRGCPKDPNEHLFSTRIMWLIRDRQYQDEPESLNHELKERLYRHWGTLSTQRTAEEQEQTGIPTPVIRPFETILYKHSKLSVSILLAIGPGESHYVVAQKLCRLSAELTHVASANIPKTDRFQQLAGNIVPMSLSPELEEFAKITKPGSPEYDFAAHLLLSNTIIVRSSQQWYMLVNPNSLKVVTNIDLAGHIAFRNIANTKVLNAIKKCASLDERAGWDFVRSKTLKWALGIAHEEREREREFRSKRTAGYAGFEVWYRWKTYAEIEEFGIKEMIASIPSTDPGCDGWEEWTDRGGIAWVSMGKMRDGSLFFCQSDSSEVTNVVESETKSRQIMQSVFTSSMDD